MDLVLLLSSPGCEARFFERGRAAREELRAGGAPAPPQPTLARPRKIPREIPLTFSCVGRKSGVCKTGPAWPSRALGAVGLGERNLEAWEEGTAPWVSPHGQPLPAARPAPPREPERASQRRRRAATTPGRTKGNLAVNWAAVGGGVGFGGKRRSAPGVCDQFFATQALAPLRSTVFFFLFASSVHRQSCARRVCVHTEGEGRDGPQAPPPPPRPRAGGGWGRGARGRGDGTRGPSPVTR